MPRVSIVSAAGAPPGWEDAFRAAGWGVDTAPSAAGLRPSADDAAWALVESALTGEIRALARSGLRYLVFGPLESMSPGRIVELLEEGADDVVSSAAPGRLILAKLRAHERAAAPKPSATLWSPGRTLKLDLKRRQAFRRLKNGWKPVAGLTETEFEILGLLLRGQGGPVERRAILDALWREQALEVRSDSVNKHVQALRRKLAGLGGHLKSLYGIGYAYREDR